MQKVAILPNTLGKSTEIITLMHPRTGRKNDFIVSDGKLYELQVVSRPHSSFFIGNSVNKDGDALIALRFHPLFMAIAEMDGKSNEFQPIDDLFTYTELKPIKQLIIPYIPEICSDLSYDGNIKCYALDEKKMVAWLVGRAEKLLPTLREKNHMEDIFLIEIAWDVISHYVSKKNSELLKSALRKKYTGSFAEHSTLITTEVKQPKLDDVKTKKPFKKKSKITERPKGVKSIDSFFNKK